MTNRRKEDVYDLASRFVIGGNIFTQSEPLPFSAWSEARSLLAIDFMEDKLVYPITINYRETQTQRVKAGHYDFDFGVTDESFPITGNGISKVDTHLKRLKTNSTSKGVLEFLDSQSMRSANSAETLMFGATYPEIQKKFPVVCIGAYCVLPENELRIITLDYTDFDRILILENEDGIWTPEFRFLAVCK